MVRPRQQAAVGEGGEHRLGARVAARREVADAPLDVVEAGCSELSERLISTLSKGGRRQQQGEQEDDKARFSHYLLSSPSGEGSGPAGAVGSPATSPAGPVGEGQLPLLRPPHLPVLTLKFPQRRGGRQSEIRSFEPSR